MTEPVWEAYAIRYGTMARRTRRESFMGLDPHDVRLNADDDNPEGICQAHQQAFRTFYTAIKSTSVRMSLTRRRVLRRVDRFPM